VTFADIYQWMGATAREKVFEILNQVQKDPSLSLKVFAYDLDEPDLMKILLALAAEGRVRMILDNAALHVGTADTPSPEDQFTTQFNQQAKGAARILRGCFARYSHDKIFIVVKGDANSTNAQSVLTGSTNFSMTGLYVNANHVLVFNDAGVAGHYSQVFEQSWTILGANGGNHRPNQGDAHSFGSSALATAPYVFQSATLPRTSITYSPHTPDDTTKLLDGVVNRINQEPAAQNGSVIFAVMQLTQSQTPVYEKLNTIHSDKSVFSYGISDAPEGIYLYAPNSNQGVLVTGKVGNAILPQPFDQLPVPPGHEIHDKFVVCGLNGADPTVYCGSSNLATGGEKSNGDNLLEIHDADVATVFAIEALLLVDHYNFLDHYGKKMSANAGSSAAKTPKPKNASKSTAAKKAAKKTPAKKAIKKAPAKKTPAKKTPAKKAAKKTPTKKAAKKAAKKTTRTASKSKR